MKLKSSAFHGLLIVDKPLGGTSRDAVDRAQRWFPRGTAVGHAGTLDPLATGVLVLGVGSATRLTEYVQRMTKVYETRVRLGARSATDDAEGPITPSTVERPPDRTAVDAALATFHGEIAQVPPAYSAAHVAGRRAYSLARKGETVDLAARRVVVHRIDVRAYEYPFLDLTVECGKGTYIRSLARDLGEQLGCGGFVETLRRTRIGGFTTETAVAANADAATARRQLLPPAAALTELPRVELGAENVVRLRSGQRIALCEAQMSPGEVVVFGPGGELVGVAEFDRELGQLKAAKVFAPGIWPPAAEAL